MEVQAIKYMGRLVAVDSDEGREIMKWEQRDYRPEAHPFPQMLYRAVLVNGSPEVNPKDVNLAAQCQKIVRDEVERSRAFEEGWRATPGEALEFHERRSQKKAEAAAQRAYEDRNMSDAAKAEIAAAEAAAGSEHLAEIPVAKRRGRPPKNPAAA